MLVTTAWFLNAIALFTTTVSALLVLLYLKSNSPRFAREMQTAELKRAYAKHERMLAIAIGLLSMWLVLQCLGLILV